jgi:hypothetical protein
LVLDLAAANVGGSCFQGESMSNAVQPRRQILRMANATGLSRKHQERCLAGILRGMNISQHAPAQAQHHRAMPRREDRKCDLIAATDISPQQFGITTEFPSSRVNQSMNVGK